LKPSLVYTILIIVVVVAATLLARSNSSVSENLGTSTKSPSNESIVQKTPTPIQEGESDTKIENGNKEVESAGRNAGDKK